MHMFVNNNIFLYTSALILPPHYVFHNSVHVCNVLSDNVNIQLFSSWHYHYRNVKLKVIVYLRSHFLFFSARYDYVKCTVIFWLHPEGR